MGMDMVFMVSIAPVVILACSELPTELTRMMAFMVILRQEMGSMDRLFDKHAEVFDISPMFRKMNRQRIEIKPGQKRSGFSVRISRTGDKPPSVSVRTFGNVDKEKIREKIQSRFGMKLRKTKPSKTVQEPERRFIPKTTEEPKSTIKRLTHKVSVDVELPKVKSITDISIKELENSVEIKAIAGSHGYFKILTKPENFRITKKEFRNGILRIEFS